MPSAPLSFPVAVDEAGTRRLRERFRSSRVYTPVRRWSGQEYDGARRVVALTEALAARLGVTEHDAVEIVRPAGPPLRGWVRVVEGAEPLAHVGPGGLRILRDEAGGRYWVRALAHGPDDEEALMHKEQVRADGVVEDMGPYAQCVRAGDFLFVAGQVAWDSQGNVVGEGDIGAQAEQVIDNLERLVVAAGGSLDAVVSMTIYLTDIAGAPVVSALRKRRFKPTYPAVTTVGVSQLVLPELLVELDAVAYVPAAGGPGG